MKKLLNVIIVKCAKVLFDFKNKNIEERKRKRLWVQKENKYYNALFYWGGDKIYKYSLKLLVSEWNR